ncbi:MAG: transglycosylase domain-containing protein [Pseudobdellovibrionaceae bacterium]|nr:transglycosylase domain-containing protein [Bdellovibrionales bacterium]USN46676.1 MAG: transglycosylase domain-containing protein [Pseudobdellovibrionaceae bacterium]
MSFKKIVGIIIALVFLGVAGIAAITIVMSSHLPKLITVNDYEPLLSTEVYDREGKKIGEFFRERRILVPYADIPEVVKQAFIAAEDSSFFEHGGVNYFAIGRAILANIKAGQRVQGASTITQQVARTLLLSSIKTYERKIKEVMLAYRMEENLSKEDILYLYLNQIYLGNGAYGVGAAAKIYFRKDIKDITVAEAAMLAGLPKAPSRFSPLVQPERSKQRQRYVLGRMQEDGYITEEQASTAAESPLNVYIRKDYKEVAPYYLETVRQMLVAELGEEMVLDKGIRVYTGLDLKDQIEAQEALREGLRELDKRQGYRGPLKNLQDEKEVEQFLLQSRNDLMDNITPVRILRPDGTMEDKGPLNLTGMTQPEDKTKKSEALPNVPDYIKVSDIVEGIVINVDDKWGLTTVRFAESKGLIDVESMEWAREPDPSVNERWAKKVERPGEVLKVGDVIQVKVSGNKFQSKRLSEKLRDLKDQARKRKKDYERPEDLPLFDQYALLELEQEPIAEGSLISFDQKTQDVLAMVGGYDYERSQFNRSLQAARQTGSAFKSLVYMSALDKGYTPATSIIDAPIVFEEEGQTSNAEEGQGQTKTDNSQSVANADSGDDEGGSVKKWKPMNHGKHFIGDILFRNALIRSLNVPTVKITEKIGVDWVADYARRLGIFSPLNMDFTLSLGSSSVTLYEMTKVFSQMGRLGRRIRPLLIHKVEDKDGNVLVENLTLDLRFKSELDEIDQQFEERRLAYLDYLRHPEKYEPLKVGLSKKEQNIEGQAADSVTPPNANLDLDPEERKRRLRVLKEPPVFFEDADQLISEQTAYVATTLLQGVVEDDHGTGRGARAIGHPTAGKTGTTDGYYDAWFVGFTPQVATGVWVGFDNERTLGRGEVGGRAALPIWVDYMKQAHEGLANQDFRVPDNIVFANIDTETGKLASADSKVVVRQAFFKGTEPAVEESDSQQEEEEDFYKKDLSE